MEQDAPTLARVIGGRMRRVRLERGWSQAALGRAVGRSRTAVCRWETGERLPSLTLLVRAARVLGCSVAELVAGAERIDGPRPQPPLPPIDGPHPLPPLPTEGEGRQQKGM